MRMVAISFLFFLVVAPMTAESDEAGIIRVRSAHSAVETVQRLEAAIHARGLTLFATIRFSDDAKAAGLSMPFTQMLIFGSPLGGTPVMIAAPSAALDLPLKALVVENPDGSIWLSCNDPLYLQARHHIPAELTKNLSGVEPLLNEVAR